MSVCPSCKAEVRDAAAPCPKCGMRPVDDVPDLVIPTRHVVPKSAPSSVAASPSAGASAGGATGGARGGTAQPQARAAPPSASSGATSGGASNVFEDEDVFGSGSASLDLDLDLSKGPPMPIASPGSIRVPASGGVIDRAPSGDRPSMGRVPSAAPPASGGARRSSEGAPAEAAMVAAEPSAIDPFEARALADYGPAPAQWWKAPAYAYRVKKRQPELRRALVLRKEEATRAEASAEDALMAFAEVVRPLAEKNARHAQALGEVAQAEQLFRARDTALAGEMDAHKQRQAQLDVGIADLEAQLTAVLAEEKVITGELAEADALLKRAETKAKRADIEIRNTMAQLEPKPQAQKVTGSQK